MPTYKLTYFEGRGRAETIRMLFALAKQDYEDNRVTGPTWQEFKAKKAPMEQLPCLEIDEDIFSQSHAIERHLANEFGLLGETAKDQLKSDEVVLSLEDIFQSIMPAFAIKDETEKQAMKDKLADEKVKPKLKLLEKFVKETGFFISNKVMLADIALYTTLEILKAFSVPVENYVDEELSKLKKIKEAVANQPEIKEWIAKRPESSF